MVMSSKKRVELALVVTLRLGDCRPETVIATETKQSVYSLASRCFSHWRGSRPVHIIQRVTNPFFGRVQFRRRQDMQEQDKIQCRGDDLMRVGANVR